MHVARTILLVLAAVVLSFLVVLSFFPFSSPQRVVIDYLDSGSGVLPFSSEANDHLEDVRRVLAFGRVIGAAVLVAAFWAFMTASSRELRVAGIAAVLLPAVLMLIPWDTLFTAFHALLFPQGNWRFPSGSLLILTFPERLFQMFALVCGVLISIMGAIMLALSFRKPSA